MRNSHVNQIIENIHKSYMNNIPHVDIVLASIITDLLHMREYPESLTFSSIELNFLLEIVCVN